MRDWARIRLLAVCHDHLDGRRERELVLEVVFGKPFINDATLTATIH